MVLTMVDGVVVAEGGRVTSVDETALLAEARELFAAKRPAIAAARGQAPTGCTRPTSAWSAGRRRRRRHDPLGDAGWKAGRMIPGRLPLHADRPTARPAAGPAARSSPSYVASASRPTGSATATPRTCCPACPHPTWSTPPGATTATGSAPSGCSTGLPALRHPADDPAQHRRLRRGPGGPRRGPRARRRDRRARPLELRLARRPDPGRRARLPRRGRRPDRDRGGCRARRLVEPVAHPHPGARRPAGRRPATATCSTCAATTSRSG